MFHTCLNKLSGGASIPLALLLSLALLIMPAQAGAITADTNAAGGDYDGIMKWDSSEFLITDSSGSSTSTVIHVNLEASNTDMGKFKPSENMVADNMAVVANIPEGLECRIEFVDPDNCAITLVGSAAAVYQSNTVENLQIEFLDDAFTSGDASRIEDSSRDDLKVSYLYTESEEFWQNVQVVTLFTVGNSTCIIDGVETYMGVAPYAETGRVYVPLRYVAYGLGMQDENIFWDGANQTVTLSWDNRMVVMQVGNYEMKVGDNSVTMDAAPQIGEDRVFLPARYVVQAFGGTVEWDPAANTVEIRY